MKKTVQFLLLVLLIAGSTHANGAEPTDAIQPDPKTSTTVSATEQGVTLRVVCPKVVLPNYGNYILMSVRNENDQSVSFMDYAPHELGIRYDIVPIKERFHGWTTISIPSFKFVLAGVDEGIRKGQEYKVLLYPTRYKRLTPGHYKIRAYWEGTRAGDPKNKIEVETKSVEFEYRENYSNCKR